MKISIKKRIQLLIVIVILVFGLLATVFVFFFARNTFLDNERQKLHEVVAEMSHEINQMLIGSSMLVKTISEQDAVIELLESNNTNTENILGEYLEMYNINGVYSSIYVMNLDGLTISSTDTNFVGNNYGYRQYFKEAINGEAGIDVVLGATSKKLGYYFSYPVKSESDEIIGVAIAKLKPEHIHNHIRTAHDQNSHIMFTDELGIVVYADSPEKIYKSLGALTDEEQEFVRAQKKFNFEKIIDLEYGPAQEAIRRGESEFLVEIYDEIDEEQEILAINKLKQAPFYLIIEEPIAKHVQAALNIAYLLSLFVLFAAIIAVLIISIFISRYLKPLKNLNLAAIRLGEGDYSVKVAKTKDGGEFNQLASVFNKTVVNLKKARADVDKKVEEQTLELERKREGLEKQQQAILNILEDVEGEKDKVSQEEKKISAILHSIGDAVFVVNKTGKIVLFNQVAQDITDCSETAAIGKLYGEIFQFLLKEDGKPDNFIEKAMDTGETINSNDEAVVSIKKDQVIPVSATAAPWLGEKSQVRGCVVVFRDVHKEREIDKAKTEFVSLASHQLRTPLSAINWYAEMLLAGDAGKINEEQRKYLDEIYAGNQRMVELVNSLLNVSRLELGTFTIEPALNDIVKICESVLKELTPIIKEKKLKITTNFPKKLAKVKIDPNLTRIIFQNLLSNAVKYTPEKGKVNVKIEASKPDILIQVDDTGMGIPKRQQREIFTKLFRADNVRETDTEGTGLGLYIVKSILDVTGGTISFSSKQGKGTSFNVTIPFKGMVARQGAKQLN